MISLIAILILLGCAVLAFFILVQNPKGGGLTGGFGSLSTQVMGVKQSTDVMEKGTWATMGIIAALCIVTVIFAPKPEGLERTQGRGKQGTAAPANQQTKAPATPQAAPGGGKK